MGRFWLKWQLNNGFFHGQFAHLTSRREVATWRNGCTRTRSAQVGYLQKTTLQLTQHRQQPSFTLLQAMQLKISLVMHLNSW